MPNFDHFYRVVYLEYKKINDDISPILIYKQFNTYPDAYYYFDQLELNRDLNTKALYLIDGLTHSVYLIRQSIFNRKTCKVKEYNYYLNEFYRSQIVEEIRNI